ncbi:MAG: NADH-quinone oxidoreductase subunit NuoE [Elusimicrobiota bacterium]
MSIQKLIKKYEKTEENVLGILEDLQQEFNYLSEEHLRLISEKFKVPLSRIYSLATFYKAFSLKPKGKHIILVCLGTACHVRGGPKIVETASRLLGIQPGETTADKLFTLETVNCLGACALGPLMVIDGKYYGKMSSAKVNKIIESYK